VEGTPFGRYQLTELLGHGGMGEVWRAYDTATQRVVAVKVLPANLANDPQFEQRFRREAFAAAGLANPHVVPIHTFGEIDGRLYVDMRLIEGRDLQSILAHGPLEPARAVGIIDQVASALHAAHRIGLVHRDVKPSNILVDEDDFAYLIDFGIARAAGETGLTGTGNVIGTWAYLAPERLTSGQTDPRADIYALTCVLYECLTGNQPFPGNSVEQQITAHLTLPPPRPSVLRVTVPTAMDTVIAKGMAKNPDDRYSTTREIAQAARAAITAPMTRPETMLPPEPLRPTQRRAEPPTRPGTPQRPQESATGGVSPSAPTQHRPPTDPNLWGQVPHGAAQTAPKKFSRKRAAILGVVSVIAVLIVVAAIVVSNQGDSSPATTTGGTSTSQTSTAVPNTGPFTGTFTADFDQQLNFSGKPAEGGPPPYKETWRLRSVCRASGCVATASTGGQFPATEVVFDDVGGRWLAVAVSAGKCKNLDSEWWQVVSLQPRPDGTMSGEWISASAAGCYRRRNVTFARTGDTDVGSLTDPASQPPRVVSPTEALRGQYHTEMSFSSGAQTQVYDFGVRTDCLRTGVRCLSFFLNPVNVLPLVFGNGKWTLSWDYETPCAIGGTSHVKIRADFPLPQPPQDPITLLTGSGTKEDTGSGCVGGDIKQKFVRTGD
jgi:serine/threonine protein kinase